MSLWVDKHRPRSLDKLKVHEKQAKQLKKLVSAGDCPHLLFYGPSGSGKKTLCLGTLKELFPPPPHVLHAAEILWALWSLVTEPQLAERLQLFAVVLD